jgi:LysR family transcriptional regulator, low CO2-responsive transcriptional regulator
VARLGSVRASAHRLGVSEPAVSGAIATLRRELGDALLVRSGGGLTLTPGGARLAAAASEILGLAEQARRGIEEARGERASLRIVATSDVAEYVAAPLVDAFTRRTTGTEVEVHVEAPDAFAPMLTDRVADIALGPRPEPADGLDATPFLRYRLIVVAAPGHRLAGIRHLPAAALAGERWLVGPSGAGPGTDVGRFLERHALAPDDVRAFSTHAAAAIGAEGGRGVMCSVAHTVMDELRRGALVRLDVRGTPVEQLWYATTLRPERRPDAASALRRFVVTPEATQAMLARSGGIPAGRFRPPLYVTLWDS